MKRYKWDSGYLDEHPDGELVYFSDVQELEKETIKLRKQLERWQKWGEKLVEEIP